MGDAAACVVKNAQGHERLGKVLMSKEKASAAWNGKEDILTGPAVQQQMVLCRSAKYHA